MITWAFADHARQVTGFGWRTSEDYTHALIWLGSLTRVSNQSAGGETRSVGSPLVCRTSAWYASVHSIPSLFNFDRFPGKCVSLENCVEIKFSFCDPGGFGMDVASAPELCQQLLQLFLKLLFVQLRWPFPLKKILQLRKSDH